MKAFDKLYTRAADRKGGAATLEKLLARPKSASALRRIADDRWLSAMSKSVFQAGFNWKVVEHKWAGFEEAFSGFDPVVVAGLSDDDLDRLMKDTRIIRNWKKVKATRQNAQLILDLAEQHGTAGKFFADYPSTEYADLLAILKKGGSWLGGTTAQYFLRGMGRDSYILSRDVVAALRREKVIEREPASAAAMRDVQKAFNHWLDDGGRSLTRISRVLAFTVGD